MTTLRSRLSSASSWLTAGLLFSASYVIADAKYNAPWRGELVKLNGIEHVKNPSVGILPPTSVQLDELWRVGGESESPHEFFGVIREIVADERHVYVLDSQLAQIRVFALDGSYLGTIGREGDGPGEFRRPSAILLLANGNLGVVQPSPAKIVTLTPNGKYVADITCADSTDRFVSILSARPQRDHILMLRLRPRYSALKVEQVISLDSVDIEGNVIASLKQFDREVKRPSPVVEEETFLTFERAGRWAVGDDGHVYVLDHGHDYAITVFSPDGTKYRIIERQYERRKRSSEEMEQLRKPWAKLPIEYRPSSYEPDILSLHPREGGALWVLTDSGSRNLASDELGRFDEFDGKGCLVRQITLRGQGNPLVDGYFFVRDRLYVVTGWRHALQSFLTLNRTNFDDSDATSMEIICYHVDSQN